MSVSVIIPTYNRAELVQYTIESVLNQSYTDYEIIVIDDGSTDDTEHQLKRYGNRINYIKQENRGLNASRNRALEIAKGEYIALLDSDDLWLDFKLDLETAILKQHPECGFVFSDFFILKPGNKYIPNGLHTWFPDTPEWGKIYQSSIIYKPVIDSRDMPKSTVKLYFGDIYHTSLHGPRVLPSASLFRKSMIDDFIKFNENDTACGDWEFFAKLSHKHSPVFIDMETALNRSHEDAVRLTRIDHKIQLGQRVSMIERTWQQDEEFYKEHKDEVDAERTRIYMQLLKYQLFDGIPRQARSTIRKIKEIDSGVSHNQLKMYKIMAFLPGMSYLIIIFRRLRHATKR